MNRTIERWEEVFQDYVEVNGNNVAASMLKKAVEDMQELARQRDELLNMLNEIEDGDLLYILGVDNFNRYVDILKGDV